MEKKTGTIRKFFGNPFIQFLGPTGAIAVITWLFTRLTLMPLWLSWLAILFSIGCGFWIVNQVAIWRKNRQGDFGRKTDDQIASIVRTWFDKRHYSSSSKIDDATLFHVVAIDDQRRKLNVFKAKGDSSAICISLILDERQMALVPQPYQDAARRQMMLEMARFGLLCQTKPPVFIALELQCDESLTESIFWNAIDKIRQGHVIISATLEKANTLAEIDKQSPSTNEQAPDKKGSQT